MLIEKKRIPVKDVLLYGLWPRLFKNIIYRLKGYRIGKKVKIVAIPQGREDITNFVSVITYPIRFKAIEINETTLPNDSKKLLKTWLKKKIEYPEIPGLSRLLFKDENSHRNFITILNNY